MAVIDVGGLDVVTARIGDDILVRLDENPTTGYIWTIAVAGDAVTVSGDEYVVPPTPMSGAAAQHTFTLKAIHAGEAGITVQLTRQWTPAQPIQQRQIRIVVR